LMAWIELDSSAWQKVKTELNTKVSWKEGNIFGDKFLLKKGFMTFSFVYT
jgi:hypothetical protein